jgi:hypothetical protein
MQPNDEAVGVEPNPGQQLAAAAAFTGGFALLGAIGGSFRKEWVTVYRIP